MAGNALPRNFDYGNPLTFGDSEPSESLHSSQIYSSIAELKRYEEIRRLGEQVAKLESENSRLEGMIKEMSEMMSNLLLRFSEVINSSEIDSNPAVIIVEEMDKSTAKQRVFDFMKVHGTSDIEELHENIRCDIGLLIEIIDELCSEGAICGGD
jgi:predicted RNase H-like nuclease (RuvC/YqgF family)